MTARGQRGRVLYEPDAARIEASRLSDFRSFLLRTRGLKFDGYAALHAWSVTDLAGFWSAILEYFEVLADGDPRPALRDSRMPGAHFFPGLQLNHAEHALRGDGARVALICCDESGARRSVELDELRGKVAALRGALVQLGVGVGDRVVAVLPNTLEAVVGLLATASLGAIWSSCPPEFGVGSVLDRFSQVEPKVLISVDAYRFGGKWFDRREQVREIERGLPSLRAVIWVRAGREPLAPGALELSELCTPHASAPLSFERVPFEHPLWILYSSGTTGKPKAIVHGHGGIVLEHYKVLALHGDLGPADRFFWYSTTGWMMWNYLIGGLLVGSTIVLYDGSPAEPDLGALWRLAERERITYFGTSAPFIMSCRERGLRPNGFCDLAALRSVGSTGAPLAPQGFEWVYEHVSPSVHLGSVSGGTDLCTAFVLGCPWHPVRAGELQCSALGAAVAAFDEHGQPVVDELAELVITQPMPSMPVGFWGDPAGERYHASYFERFPGVWRHGDWIRQFADGAAVITGRSDATLNRGGVRMGTAEFYRVVEELPEVADSLVVDVAASALGEASRLWLFVVPSEPTLATPELARAIAASLRAALSPRHVPDRIQFISEVPYTLSGKKLELPVKRLFEGHSIAEVASPGTLRNPAALDALAALASDAR